MKCLIDTRRFVITLLLLNSITLFAQPKIILKLDDLEAKTTSIDACIPTLEYLVNNGIKAGWGVMRISAITESQIATLKNYLGKTNAKGENLFEFWHHGLEHSRDNPAGTWEFSGTTYDYQKSHFDSAAALMKNKLGVTARTFGAPYNQTDATLHKVMSEDPNMKVILLSSQTPSAASGIMNLKNRVNMESATGVVGYSYFLTNYNTYKSTYKDYMVLQGHPPQWTTDSLKNEFKKIVAFLISEGCEFVTPYGYYCFVKNINTGAHESENPCGALRSYHLLQNYPNPFNPATIIQFSVPAAGHATLKIFNALGQETAMLFNKYTEGGILNSVEFLAQGLPSGIYLSRLDYAGTSFIRKIVLAK